MAASLQPMHSQAHLRNSTGEEELPKEVDYLDLAIAARPSAHKTRAQAQALISTASSSSSSSSASSSSPLAGRTVTAQPSQPPVAPGEELDALDLIEQNAEGAAGNAAPAPPNPEPEEQQQQLVPAAPQPENQRPAKRLALNLTVGLVSASTHRIVTFAVSHFILYGLFFSRILRGVAYAALIPIAFRNLNLIDREQFKRQRFGGQEKIAYFFTNLALDVLFYARYFQWIALPLPAFIALNATAAIASGIFAFYARPRG